MNQIFEIGRYQNKTKPKKNWGYQNGGSPKQGLPKVKLFNLLSWTHEIFKVSIYKKKINFNQILGYQYGGPPNEATKIQNFLTTLVRHMKF